MKNLPRRWCWHVLAMTPLLALVMVPPWLGDAVEQPLAKASSESLARPRARTEGPFQMLRAYAWASNLDGPSTAWVRFSRALDPIQPPPPIALEPPVAHLSVTVRDEELRLSGDLEPGRVYRVSIGARLRAADGQTLGERASAILRVPDRAPHLS